MKNKINYLDPCTRLLASPAVKPEENVGCGRSGIVRNFRNEVTLKLAVAVPPPVTLRDLLYNAGRLSGTQCTKVNISAFDRYISNVLSSSISRLI